MKKYFKWILCLLCCLALCAPGLAENDRPDREYYPNGDLRTVYAYDSQGRISREDFYNRYGVVTSYTIYETYDEAGNPRTYTTYFPYSAKIYGEYHYTCVCDEEGRELEYTGTCADGSFSSRCVATYDSQGRTASRTYYLENGAVESYQDQFIYDAEDHLLSCRSLNADRSPESTYIAVWNGGYRSGYQDIRADGVVLREGQLDQYGDFLLWCNYNPESDSYSREVTTYDSNGYREEYWSMDAQGTVSWHSVYNYSTSEIKVSYESYSSDGSESRTEYTNNAKGQPILGRVRSVSADGTTDSYMETYEYDELDRQILQTTYYSNGQPQYIRQTKYDPDGTSHSQTDYYNEDGSFWFAGDWY